MTPYQNFVLPLNPYTYIAGEMMSVAEPFLQQSMHPTLIISAYKQAMEDMLQIMKDKCR